MKFKPKGKTAKDKAKGRGKGKGKGKRNFKRRLSFSAALPPASEHAEVGQPCDTLEQGPFEVSASQPVNVEGAAEAPPPDEPAGAGDVSVEAEVPRSELLAVAETDGAEAPPGDHAAAVALEEPVLPGSSGDRRPCLRGPTVNHTPDLLQQLAPPGATIHLNCILVAVTLIPHFGFHPFSTKVALGRLNTEHL